MLSHSLFTSLLFGLLLLGLQFSLSRAVTTQLCGTATASVPFAIQYAQIRSLAAPFALPTIVGQAAFLAVKDAVTPLKAVLVGAVVNVVGDLLLVSVLNKGVAGAAIATTASQALGALYLLFVALQNLAATSPSRTVRWKDLKTYLHVPSIRDMAKYLAFCGPLFLILLVKTVLWTYTTLACSTAGAVELAAHQITINFFLFFCIFGDVVSQISQTFLPYFIADRQRRGAAEESLLATHSFRETAHKVCTVATWLGIGNCLLCGGLEKFGYRFITSSQEVVDKLHAASKLLMLSVLPHSLLLALEGAVRD